MNDCLYPKLLSPERLWTREEVLSTPCPVPAQRGVYAWYFKDIPVDVPTKNCVMVGDLTLLYVGISPRRNASKQNLRTRIRYHFKGQAGGSTLRITLGCLMSGQLGIELRRVGSGNVMTFTKGEQNLSKWMANNAFVTWMTCDEPWKIEDKIIQNVSLPLNLDQNQNHAFHPILNNRRALAKKCVRRLDILPR
jgi:hypothetical protein